MNSSTSSSILVCGDRTMADVLSEHLGDRGYIIRTVSSGESVTASLRSRRPDVVFVADKAPSKGWEPELLAIREAEADFPVVVVTQHLTPDLLLSAASHGATDCLGFPVDPGLLEDTMSRIGRTGRPSARCQLHQTGHVSPAAGDMVVGRSPAMIEALRVAGSVAEGQTKVLIRGETGTGKELLASAIHRASGRQGAFVAVNCAAVVENLAESELFGHERGAFTGAVARRAGCFEQADGGTLFLDEIGDASVAFQAKLLRVLDRGEYYRVGGA